MGKRNLKVSRAIVSSIESDDSAKEHEEDDYHPRIATPPLELESEDK